MGVVRQTETRALKQASDNRNAPFTRKLTDLYTAATWVDDLDTNDTIGLGPTGRQAGLVMCLVEEGRGGSGSHEKVRFGMLAVQPATGDVIYDGKQAQTKPGTTEIRD